MLTEDAIIAMPPMPTWYQGRDAVVGFVRRYPLGEGRMWRVVPVGASGQLAFGFYAWDDDAGAFVAHDVIVLTMEGERIAELIAFLEPAAFASFGLPPVWASA